jgi:hypothetical protein
MIRDKTRMGRGETYYAEFSTGRAVMAKRKISNYKTDRRRKHHHWLVTVTYSDNESFRRVYIDRERAEKFAARQKKSPIVKKTRIRQLS